MSQSDDELRPLLETLVLTAVSIGSALPDDAPSELGDTLAALVLAELSEDRREQMRIIFRELRKNTDRGFSVLDRALRKPQLRVVGR